MEDHRRLWTALWIVLATLLMVEAAGSYLAFRGVPDGEPRAARRPTRRERPDEVMARHAQLTASLASLLPRGVYILIDTGGSTLQLRDKNRIIREAVASSGSGSMLIEPNGKKTWVFDTPRGAYRVESKTRQPVWRKPDWAFIEEGKPIPKNVGDRLEEGVLGEYALGFGAGYFIHGTLYTRLLGKNVTHGCVRLDDEALKVVYRAVDIGTQIYIY
jgi:hypothetical protein